MDSCHLFPQRVLLIILLIWGVQLCLGISLVPCWLRLCIQIKKLLWRAPPLPSCTLQQWCLTSMANQVSLHKQPHSYTKLQPLKALCAASPSPLLVFSTQPPSASKDIYLSGGLRAAAQSAVRLCRSLFGKSFTVLSPKAPKFILQPG